MPPTGSFSDSFNEEYFDPMDEDSKRKRHAKFDALDVTPMKGHYGKRVLLIEEVDGERLGVLDATIVNTGDPTKLRLLDTSGFSPAIDISQPNMFDWHADKYFMRSTFWRRRKYLTPKARQHRAHCHHLFDMALGRELFTHSDIGLYRECSMEVLRQEVSRRWGSPENTPVSELLTRLEGV